MSGELSLLLSALGVSSQFDLWVVSSLRSHFFFFFSSPGDREKGARESASTLKKRTIRDFYSLSPKQPNTSTSPRVSAAKKEVTPKKRVVGKFIGLNQEVAPIHVHVPFRGQDTHIFAIDAHCIDSKYDVSDRPVVLTGTFPGRLNVPIKRFLRGFGRYIH